MESKIDYSVLAQKVLDNNDLVKFLITKDENDGSSYLELTIEDSLIDELMVQWSCTKEEVLKAFEQTFKIVLDDLENQIKNADEQKNSQ